MKRIVWFVMIIGLLLAFVPVASAKSAYVVAQGDVVNELSLSVSDVKIYGEVKSLNLGAGKVTIYESGKVKNLSQGMGDILVLGEAMDIKLGVGNIDISGKVLGDIELGLGDIILRSTSVVEGDISTVGNINKEEGHFLRGDVSAMGVSLPGLKGFFKDQEWLGTLPARIFKVTQTAKLIGLITTVLLGLLLLALFPLAVQRGSEFLASKPWSSLLLTLSLTVITIGLSLLLAITIIGIPAAILIWPIIFLFGMFGGVIVYKWVGEMLLRAFKWHTPPPAVAFLVGAIPLLLIRNFIPLGFLVGLIVFLFGLGAAFKSAFPRANVFGL